VLARARSVERSEELRGDVEVDVERWEGVGVRGGSGESVAVARSIEKRRKMGRRRFEGCGSMTAGRPPRRD